MYKLIRPEKDATIYEYAPTANAGIDEVLELNTRRCREFQSEADALDDPAPSRILMEFPTIEEEIEPAVESGPNVFASFGFSTPTKEEQERERDPVEEIGIDPPKNVFGFFGEEIAPKRQSESNNGTENESGETGDEKVETAGASAWLRLWFANGMGLPRKYQIEAYPLEKRWTEGRGRIENVPPTEEPVNWTEANESESWKSPGGDFDESVSSKEVFDRADPDVNLNLNNVLSSDPEQGILLKRGEEEFDRRTELKFFSLETRTIYVPHLLLGTDDYRFEPEGADPVESENFEAFITNLQNTYREGRKVRFEVAVREKYSQREFLGIRPTERTDSIEGERYAPKRSITYEVEDVRTGVKFFPFDRRYTAVSFDGDKHFFDLDLTNLLPKRKYRITLRYEDPETGAIKYFEDEQTFRIE